MPVAEHPGFLLSAEAGVAAPDTHALNLTNAIKKHAFSVFPFPPGTMSLKDNLLQNLWSLFVIQSYSFNYMCLAL